MKYILYWKFHIQGRPVTRDKLDTRLSRKAAEKPHFSAPKVLRLIEEERIFLHSMALKRDIVISISC